MSSIVVTTNNGDEYTVDTGRYVVLHGIAWTIGQQTPPSSSALIVASMVTPSMITGPAGRSRNLDLPPTPDWDSALLASAVDEWPEDTPMAADPPNGYQLQTQLREVARALMVEV